MIVFVKGVFSSDFHRLFCIGQWLTQSHCGGCSFLRCTAQASASAAGFKLIKQWKEQFKRKGVNKEIGAVTFNGAVLSADQCRVLHRPLLILSLNCFVMPSVYSWEFPPKLNDEVPNTF